MYDPQYIIKIRTDRLGLVSLGEVQKLLSCSRWTVRNKVNAGKFPHSRTPAGSGYRTMWDGDQIVAWVLAYTGKKAELYTR